jgi:hypothetical protein
VRNYVTIFTRSETGDDQQHRSSEITKNIKNTKNLQTMKQELSSPIRGMPASGITKVAAALEDEELGTTTTTTTSSLNTGQSSSSSSSTGQLQQRKKSPLHPLRPNHHHPRNEELQAILYRKEDDDEHDDTPVCCIPLKFLLVMGIIYAIVFFTYWNKHQKAPDVDF